MFHMSAYRFTDFGYDCTHCCKANSKAMPNGIEGVTSGIRQNVV
ncbi:unnamed protein product [Acanthoscelides obtectus]|uniref:Uncharacterized protein n=1 Tax=Acanthoscelides obtectus TaxID=200917 RepID=A0A9P0LGL1_ACAOB|nr:unnamed protein product [Acanthoscelides obtectus]CAK1620010.1 hypothetical protein AOBTE_LOCUS131 [Acanthoscelides obtectus]